MTIPLLPRRFLLVSAWLVTAWAVRAAEPFPPGFFAYETIHNPDRTYYEELSDTEYDSIRPERYFYPYVLDVWPNAPLTDKGFFTVPEVSYTTDADVELQAYILENNDNPYARGNTVTYLSRYDNRIAVDPD